MKSANKKAQKKQKGFTLLEVLVAISIFSVVLTGVSGIFGNFVKNYRSTKAVQRNLENAQFAINQMAKILRTSKIVDPTNNPASSQSIDVYDYSQNRCFRFEFTGNNITKETTTASMPGTCDPFGGDVEKMVYASSSSGEVVTTTGKFFYPIASTNNAAASWNVGMVTILAEVAYGADKAHIQTTVSLRDYVNTQ